MQIEIIAPDDLTTEEFGISILGLNQSEYENLRKLLLSVFEVSGVESPQIENLKLFSLNSLLLSTVNQ